LEVFPFGVVPTYAAKLFSEYFYEKRYKPQNLILTRSKDNFNRRSAAEAQPAWQPPAAGEGSGMLQLNFDKMGGLVPVVAQDYRSGEVLMLAFMDESAWRTTLETGRATYFSRSRRKLWVKGETSGHLQLVKEIWIDCDNDTILLKIEQKGGAACHTGHRSCFHRKVENADLREVGQPVFDPKEVYKQ
jgi:phosphoribosyl-AMP cyclohydrolase